MRQNSRWLASGFLLTVFSGFGQTFFISLSSGELRQTFALSHGDLGLIYMTATLASAAVLPWVGKSVDVYPAHRVAVAVISMLALFCLAMAAVNSVAMLFVVIFGLRLFGQGMMTHISMTAMARWFSAQRGRAVSIASLGFPASESLFPSAFVLAAGVIGWRSGWLLAASVLMILALPAIYFLLRRERQPGSAEQTVSKGRHRHWTRAEVLRDPFFWLVSAGVLGPPFINTAILFNQVYIVSERGWSMELFAGSFVVMAVSAVVASLVLGSLIDRFNARAVLPFALLPLGMACVVLALFHHPAAAFLFMGLMGLSNGFIATLMGALWPEIYGTHHIGAIRSLVFAMMVFASAAGPGLMGILIDARVALDDQLLAMGLYCLALTVVLNRAAAMAKNR